MRISTCSRRSVMDPADSLDAQRLFQPREVRGSWSGRRIANGVEGRAKPGVVDMRRAARGFSNCIPRHESPPRKGTDFRHRSAIARDHQRLAGLHFAQYGCGAITQLSLVDYPGHLLILADVASIARGKATDPSAPRIRLPGRPPRPPARSSAWAGSTPGSPRHSSAI